MCFLSEDQQLLPWKSELAQHRRGPFWLNFQTCRAIMPLNLTYILSSINKCAVFLFQCLTSNIKGLWNWTWQKYWISCSYEKIKNKNKKQNKQMFKICTILLSNIFLGIWYRDLGYPPPPTLPTPTPMKVPAIPHWGVILSSWGNCLFFSTPMDICWSHSIATVSHSSLVENIESARQDWLC